MRPFLPYLGIAFAVALGVALAPYLGWIVLAAVACFGLLLAIGFLRIGWRAVMRRVRRVMVLVYHYFDQTPAPPG